MVYPWCIVKCSLLQLLQLLHPFTEVWFANGAVQSTRPWPPKPRLLGYEWVLTHGSRATPADVSCASHDVPPTHHVSMCFTIRQHVTELIKHMGVNLLFWVYKKNQLHLSPSWNLCEAGAGEMLPLFRVSKLQSFLPRWKGWNRTASLKATWKTSEWNIFGFQKRCFKTNFNINFEPPHCHSEETEQAPGLEHRAGRWWELRCRRLSHWDSFELLGFDYKLMNQPEFIPWFLMILCFKSCDMTWFEIDFCVSCWHCYIQIGGFNIFETCFYVPFITVSRYPHTSHVYLSVTDNSSMIELGILPSFLIVFAT